MSTPGHLAFVMKHGAITRFAYKHGRDPFLIRAALLAGELRVRPDGEIDLNENYSEPEWLGKARSEPKEPPDEPRN